MKRFFILVVVLSFFLPSMAGCKKRHVGKTVPPDCGYAFEAPETVKTAQFKNMTIEYTVRQLEQAGKYVFDGQARMKGTPASGSRIKSIEFRILPIRDGVIVDNLLLNSHGFGPGRPISLSKEFVCEEGFDRLTFDWVIWYYK